MKIFITISMSVVWSTSMFSIYDITFFFLVTTQKLLQVVYVMLESRQINCRTFPMDMCLHIVTIRTWINMLRTYFLYYAGMRKSYWITCNVEPNIQHLSLDKGRFPSNFVVRPRDLNRLLGNFQSSLQEITIIATEPNSLPSDVANEIGGKAVELRSYIDPTKGIKNIVLCWVYNDQIVYSSILNCR